MFENVIVGLKEGLPHSPLLDLAARTTVEGGRIHLLTLVKAGTYEDEPERLKGAEQELRKRAAELEKQSFDVSYQVDLIALAAASELLRVAQERSSDLIVIGLAKRTRVGKALMGSDAQRVLLAAQSPVLVTQLYG